MSFGALLLILEYLQMPCCRQMLHKLGIRPAGQVTSS